MEVRVKRLTLIGSKPVLGLVLLVSLTSVPRQSPCLAQDVFQSLLGQFSQYDINGDGIQEIDGLELISFEAEQDAVPQDARLVVVLVEPRLLEPVGDWWVVQVELLYRLNRFKGDLRAEGYATRFVQATVYAGNRHQDGRTVLALRDFFTNVKVAYPNLQGVILVGSFPEPMLGRRWLWKKTAGEGGITIGGTAFAEGTEYLQIVPEIVADRADLVMADLDGRWEDIYEEGPKNLESTVAKPDVAGTANWYQNNTVLDCSHYDRTNVSFEDFFWIKDDNYTSWFQANKLQIQIFTAQLHPEMNSDDKSLANPVARPDIFVSRINPLHIAVNPDPLFVDDYGKGYLAADGKPQSVESSTPIDLNIKSFWKRDRKLELRILIDYFDRNHRYRVGGYSHLPFRTAAVGKDLSVTGFNAMLRKASSDFGASVVVEDASLLDYVNWLAQSACYRGITAHSNAWNSSFGNNYNTGDLEAAVGGRPWRWKKHGSTNLYEPSLADQGGAADLYLHRTMWENGILRDSGGRLYIHNGCQANTPEGFANHPYNHEFYGTFQNAEGVLFYLNGVALTARSKVFYDTPRGFSEALGKTERSHFGNGWRAYFDEEGKDAGLAALVADNKRCYNWSLLGDWTVRLRYFNGLGIITLAGSELTDYAVHANNAWIGGWNYSSNLNEIEGIGDFNGDSRADIIVSSSWGIGIVQLQGSTLTPIVAEPKGTRFGGWLYNPDDNIIQGIADFDGNGRDDILISSPWGVGILTLQGSTLTSVVAEPKGTWFGGWHYNPDDNIIQGTGDFDGNSKDDILVSSPWGIGILTLQGSTLAPIVAEPKGTWFGGWHYNPDDNLIEGVGDFDGNGTDDILVSSPWGIGTLTIVQGPTLTAVVAQPKGTWFGWWHYNPDDNLVEGVGDFDGNGTDDILISSPWGIGILTRDGSSLVSIDMRAYYNLIGKWYLTEADLVCGVGSFDCTHGAQILLKKLH